MRNATKLLMGSGIVIELSGVILIAKAIATDSSPALGIILLAIGLIVLVIGRTATHKESQTGPS